MRGAGGPDGDIKDWMGTCYIDRLSRWAIERKRRRRLFGGLHTYCIQWLLCRLHIRLLMAVNWVNKLIELAVAVMEATNVGDG